MSRLSRLSSAARELLLSMRLPSAPKPQGDGIGQRPEQSTPAGLVSDFAIDRFVTALTRLPDPDEVLRRAGLYRHDLKRLEYDDEISGALETRREAAITTQWRLDADADGTPTEAASFVEAELRRVFDPMMRGFWQAVPYGYSVSEAIYAQREGRIGIGRVSIKPMQWFEPLRDGRLVLARPGEGQRVALDTQVKFCMLTRNATFENPYGEALLSRLYWPWYFRHAGWKAWMQFVDRFGDPFVVGKSATPRELVSALLGMGVKNVIGVGSEDEIDVMMQNGDATFDRLDQRLTERIQKTILGQTLTSGNGGGAGSYALGKVHEQVRQDKRLSDVRLLQQGGQWLVDALWQLNAFPGQPPKFIFADPADIALERSKRDVGLKSAGIVNFTKDYLMRAYAFEAGDIELPEAEPTPADLEPQPQRQAQPGAELWLTGDEHVPRARGRRQFTAAQRVIERLGDAAMEHAPTSPLSVAELRAAIIGAKDRDDLEDRLAALIERQAPEFRQVLARSVFAAEVLGYLHAHDSH